MGQYRLEYRPKRIIVSYGLKVKLIIIMNGIAFCHAFRLKASCPVSGNQRGPSHCHDGSAMVLKG